MPLRTERFVALGCCLALALGGEAGWAQLPMQGQGERGQPVEQPRPPSRPALDEVGYAGVAAGDEHGDAGAITAIHASQPASSYAEITSLTTGRTILVRVARQGALADGRLIDLPCGAAGQLGLTTFPAPIRVRRVYPPEQEQAQLELGKPVAERLPSPPGLLSALRRKLRPAPHGTGGRGGECALAPSDRAPSVENRGNDDPPPVEPTGQAISVDSVKPVKSRPRTSDRMVPAPVPKVLRTKAPTPVTLTEARAKGPTFAIQIAALSSRGKADALARSLGGYVETAGGISRVRKGPYASEAAARAVLPQIHAKGFADARVVTNEGR